MVLSLGWLCQSEKLQRSVFQKAGVYVRHPSFPEARGLLQGQELYGVYASASKMKCFDKMMVDEQENIWTTTQLLIVTTCSEEFSMKIFIIFFRILQE